MLKEFIILTNLTHQIKHTGSIVPSTELYIMMIIVSGGLLGFLHGSVLGVLFFLHYFVAASGTVYAHYVE